MVAGRTVYTLLDAGSLPSREGPPGVLPDGAGTRTDHAIDQVTPS